MATREEVGDEVGRLSGCYARLFGDIRVDLGDLREHRRMSRAIELAEATGEHLNHN